MKDLIAKLEAATEGSRELDARIWWAINKAAAARAFWSAAVGPPRELPDDYDRLPRGLGLAAVGICAPGVTRSLDAALTLVQKGLGWIVSDADWSTARASVSWKNTEITFNVPVHDVRAATPALALCIAALKSRVGVGEGE